MLMQCCGAAADHHDVNEPTQTKQQLAVPVEGSRKRGEPDVVELIHTTSAGLQQSTL